MPILTVKSLRSAAATRKGRVQRVVRRRFVKGAEVSHKEWGRLIFDEAVTKRMCFCRIKGKRTGKCWILADRRKLKAV